MSEAKTKKQLTHQRMLDAASQSFRGNGFSGIGVDGIAKAAGVTSGAFYAHFGSKDKAFKAALEAGLDEVIEAVPKFQQDNGKDWVSAFVEYYTGKPHRKNLQCGCAMTTLTPEVVRASPELHALYESKMKQITELLANGLKGQKRQERVARAWALIGILTGGLTLSRAVKTEKAAEEIAASIRASAIAVAGKVSAKPE